MQLLLVRHGRPHQMTGNDSAVDPALDDVGLQQAEAVAVALTAGHFGRVTGVASSTMRRALETARPTAQALGLSTVTDRRIVELDDGATQYGNGFSEHSTRREAWAALNAGRWNGHDFDPAAFAARVVEGIEEVARTHLARTGADGPEDSLAVFCHGGVISAFVGHVLRAAEPLFTSPAYGSVTRVLVEADGHREVLSLNESAHLRGIGEAARDADRRAEPLRARGTDRA